MRDGGEPSEYERLIEEKRQERLLKQQIKKYGDDAMRVEPAMAMDSSDLRSVTTSHRQRVRAGSPRPAPGGAEEEVRLLARDRGVQIAR
eukprot:COSAG06_NODE_2911_length_6102_cov_2.217724_3_plen_89_part_00